MDKEELVWSDFCPICKNLDNRYGACTKFHFNVFSSPKTFSKKCGGTFFLKDNVKQAQIEAQKHRTELQEEKSERLQHEDEQLFSKDTRECELILYKGILSTRIAILNYVSTFLIILVFSVLDIFHFAITLGLAAANFILLYRYGKRKSRYTDKLRVDEKGLHSIEYGFVAWQDIKNYQIDSGNYSDFEFINIKRYNEPRISMVQCRDTDPLEFQHFLFNFEAHLKDYNEKLARKLKNSQDNSAQSSNPLTPETAVNNESSPPVEPHVIQEKSFYTSKFAKPFVIGMWIFGAIMFYLTATTIDMDISMIARFVAFASLGSVVTFKAFNTGIRSWKSNEMEDEEEKDTICATSIDDVNNVINTNGSEELFSKGVKLYEQLKFDKAEVAFKQALEKDPESEDIFYNLALVYLEQKKYNKAWEYVEKLKERNVDCSEIIKELKKV